ncbi:MULTISPECIES: RsmD family RNA methyltransferase [Auritidibacter]|uniref:RsmD family RNA methyltransferase n=1 Tax=Auritidibacter TaxID=1160973 RepID=UPI000D736230|nr:MULTISPECIES: RsmD family RNA methyltransferase [Auritidibacter]AXR73290.1 methyltransferase domain-containing protein [Auritidibacter sp. NML130574]NIH70940.1 16S rRNA (guanine966-N2)-methyltransferase [Auritidibacter ignavus]PXA82045.1 16S rRNA (guanine(966)-N(2))-methyltransferase RsmD [Auritidibacter sp. NML120636]RMX24107.1 methyltransferase domain-containing protein [Auritidibacter ignavus]WGH81856.1 RsmD family RNA methyltransferase [Auritidibacter ignavus]
MNRIIAGAAGGLRLKTLAGDHTRPSAARTKEAVFSWLETKGWLDNTRVLDLFAGSGALGAEAASRGAQQVISVDNHRQAVAVARDNAQAVNRALGGSRKVITVRQATVEKFLPLLATRLAGEKNAHGDFDLALADPPYPIEGEKLDQVLALIFPALVVDGLLVLERSARSQPPRFPAATEIIDTRTYGESAVFYVRKVPRD